MVEATDTGQRPPATTLKRTVGTLLLFFFIVGDTLGAGIYTLIGTMAADVGGMLWLPLVLALVLALLTAGTYAEMITKYPHAGGACRYVQRAFDIPYLSFVVGFLMLSSGITTAALLANAFAGDYLSELVAVPAAPVSVVFLLLLIAGWNEFLYAFTLTITPETRLLTVRLFEVPVRADANTIPYDLIAAGGVLILLPLVPLLVRVQRQLVQGLMAGALKG